MKLLTSKYIQLCSEREYKDPVNSILIDGLKRTYILGFSATMAVCRSVKSLSDIVDKKVFEIIEQYGAMYDKDIIAKDVSKLSARNMIKVVFPEILELLESIETSNCFIRFGSIQIKNNLNLNNYLYREAISYSTYNEISVEYEIAFKILREISIGYDISNADSEVVYDIVKLFFSEQGLYYNKSSISKCFQLATLELLENFIILD